MLDAPVMPPGAHRDPGRYFHAVAIDFDGTLATEGHVDPKTLLALADTRDKGTRVIVVTGRILAELREVAADLESYCDAVVAENGCVISTSDRSWTIAQPVDPRLSDLLAQTGLGFRRGEVILACSGTDEPKVLGAVRRLGLACQLIRNRGELMVLPAGVTKATGLLSALTELGISSHNTVAIGDAENDLPMLESCELGVAVANAIEALKIHADLVLPESSGLGVANFLRGQMIAAPTAPSSARLGITLGTDDAGAPVRLPTSRLNIAILGASGEGKSYVAGLVAEQLVALRYSLLVIDPEGDFLGLADLPGVLRIDAAHTLPPPEAALHPFVHSDLSVVIDLSGVDDAGRIAYVAGLRSEVSALRARIGRPHWVIIDEAQDALSVDEAPNGWGLSPGETGHCLATWRSDILPGGIADAIDAVVLVGSNPSTSELQFTTEATGLPEDMLRRQLAPGEGRALLARRLTDAPLTALSIAPRRTAHSRHEHKYRRQGVGPSRQFYFRRDDQSLTGAEATNLEELQQGFKDCDAQTLFHHLSRGDLSRWISEVFRDRSLAGTIAGIEHRGLLENGILEVAREELLDALARTRR